MTSAWADDLLCQLDLAEGEDAVFAHVRRAAETLGFEYCAYGMRLPGPMTRPRIIMVNNYPAAWQERYARRRYVDVDPTVRHGRRTERPIIWSDEVFSASPDLWSETRDAGLRVGWARSSLEGPGIGGMLTLARSDEPISERSLAATQSKMRWLASVAHQSFRRVLAHRWVVSLSSREREVLRWAADGKTFAEISKILNISIATAKFHARNAATKLGAPNLTATVARAAMLGLLAE